MITCDFTGNLGNHLFQYAVVREVAERNGYQWGFNKTPSHDYLGGKEQMDFLEIDYGIEHNTPFGQLPANIDSIWYERYESFRHIDMVDYHPYQEDIFTIPDNTKLVIRCCQDARYFTKDSIRRWFKIREEKQNKYEHILKTSNLDINNLCVINVRAGSEYLSLPTVLLPKSYYLSAIEYIPKGANFIVVSDNPEWCRNFLPFPAYHFSIGMDYYLVNKARYLILSNSSFGIFPAWLNSNAEKTIAPKFWARYNVSNGYWANSDVSTFGFTFIDRNGNEGL